MNHITTEIQFFCDRAEELYNNIHSHENSQTIPSPLHWLENQDYFRSMWIYIKSLINDCSISFIFDQNVINYMKFMYETFPAGFGMNLRRTNNSGGTTHIIIN